MKKIFLLFLCCGLFASWEFDIFRIDLSTSGAVYSVEAKYSDGKFTRWGRWSIGEKRAITDPESGDMGQSAGQREYVKVDIFDEFRGFVDSLAVKRSCDLRSEAKSEAEKVARASIAKRALCLMKRYEKSVDFEIGPLENELFQKVLQDKNIKKILDRHSGGNLSLKDAREEFSSAVWFILGPFCKTLFERYAFMAAGDRMRRASAAPMR